jgi:hypothetical protein
MKPACRNQCIVNTVFSLVSMRLGVRRTQPFLPRGEALEYSLIDIPEFDRRPGRLIAAPRYRVRRFSNAAFGISFNR